MATALRTFGKQFVRRISSQYVSYETKTIRPKRFPILVACGCAAGSVVVWYAYNKTRKMPPMSMPKEAAVGQKQAVMQTQRELRFLSFASVEYEGNIYMTPQDFLESVTEEVPRPRTGRSRIFRHDVERFLRNTPPRHKGSMYLFRSLHDKGIISYTEYLFLLCVLTKPLSGFRIAFNMFDTDGDQRVDKKEFLVLLNIFENVFTDDETDETDGQIVKYDETDAPNKTTVNIWQLVTADIPEADEGGDVPVYLPDTTLLKHFFGRRGRDTLQYEDFHSFMENLQTEVLELEFNEFAKGMPTITEEEFAHILLRYTILSKDDHQEYIIRLRQRIPHSRGISFSDFKDFGMFLNNLDDFAMAIRMYTYANQPISEDEFRRAVKVCTGMEMNPHVVHTVFQLFDTDGDGNLSHEEFVSVMKDRIHRGFKQQLPTHGRWDVFKQCVRTEMKKS